MQSSCFCGQPVRFERGWQFSRCTCGAKWYRDGRTVWGYGRVGMDSTGFCLITKFGIKPKKGGERRKRHANNN